MATLGLFYQLEGEGTSTAVEVDFMATVGDLRAVIKEQSGLRDFTLKWSDIPSLGGTEEEERRTLADLGIGPQNTIFVEPNSRCLTWKEGTPNVNGPTLEYNPTGGSRNFVAYCGDAFHPLGTARTVRMRQKRPHGSYNHAVGLINEAVKSQPTNTVPQDGIFFGWRSESMYAYSQNPGATAEKGAFTAMANVALDKDHVLNQNETVIELRLVDNGDFEVWASNPEKEMAPQLLFKQEAYSYNLNETGKYRFAVYLFDAHTLTLE